MQKIYQMDLDYLIPLKFLKNTHKVFRNKNYLIPKYCNVIVKNFAHSNFLLLEFETFHPFSASKNPQTQ